MMGASLVQNVNQKSHLNLATKNVIQYTLGITIQRKGRGR